MINLRRVRRIPEKVRQYTTRLKRRIVLGFYEPEYDGMQDFTRMKFLYDTVQIFAKPQSSIALEIGVFMGCSLVFLAHACLSRGITRVYGMDTFTGTASWKQTFDTYNAAQTRLEAHKLTDHVKLIRSHSQAYPWSDAIDVLHIDADHEGEAVRRDIQKYTPFVTEGGLIVFDDYDSVHPGVKAGVHELLLGGEYEIAAVNCFRADYGSICLRKCTGAP